MKKAYFVFKGEKFIGFITDKKILKRFKKERGDKYNIHEVDALDLESILNKSQIEAMLIDEFREFGKVMTQLELAYIYQITLDHGMELNFNYMDLLRSHTRVRFTKEEKKVILAFIELLEDIIGDLSDIESCVTPYEYFDTELLFKMVAQRY